MDFSHLNICVVDNGGQWTHREYRVLRDLGATVRIVPNTAPIVEIKEADALVLSGGAPSVYAEREKLGRLGDYLDHFDGPVLGICVGHQYIAHHFGGVTGPGSSGEYGKTSINVLFQDELFREIPSSFQVWASHTDEVKKLPPGFILLASSNDCPVEAMASKNRPIYGVQFHPEVEDTEHGRHIFSNFLLRVLECK
ncbi:MAG: GMP synthase subunit A [Methanomassiliicoccales archaeon]